MTRRLHTRRRGIEEEQEEKKEMKERGVAKREQDARRDAAKSQAKLLIGGFMFVCCTGRDSEGKFALGDARRQTQQCIDNIRALIEEAGGTLKDVVKCTVYVCDRAHWEPMNEVFFGNFTDDPTPQAR